MLTTAVAHRELAARLRARRLAVPVRSNLWQVVRFELEGIEFERRLVPEVEDVTRDISASSPVGKALLRAAAGERIVVQAPGGDVVVKVLGVSTD